MHHSFMLVDYLSSTHSAILNCCTVGDDRPVAHLKHDSQSPFKLVVLMCKFLHLSAMWSIPEFPHRLGCSG